LAFGSTFSGGGSAVVEGRRERRLRIALGSQDSECFLPVLRRDRWG
jgi:hypothetical protein